MEQNHRRPGRQRGHDYGATLWALIEQYQFVDQEMGSLALRGEIIVGDPAVEYHFQKWVREGVLVRYPTRLYGHTVYYHRGLRSPSMAHQYRVAKLTHHLMVHAPVHRSVALHREQIGEGIKPDAALLFVGYEVTTIYIEYQTVREAWTTPKKIAAYQAMACSGLKLFLIERSYGFLTAMAQVAAAGDYCFADPSEVLTTSTPWETPVFYFGGPNPKKLALLRQTG